ncbi:hypothetical protein PR202_ga19650 [Eleusine coracana subsp. coracana]|uniref:Knottins-like domain-containing protein n=1 Tax=Eleusine coracana subsp. coracana TaxID=191504 RepID=A0AAV5CVZ1_ELECO|nr:hypothetical protein PR202_ga19650 [Eleusine coracana subsp. coracana]
MGADGIQEPGAAPFTLLRKNGFNHPPYGYRARPLRPAPPGCLRDGYDEGGRGEALPVAEPPVRGACMRERNCRHVCNTEGFPWGDCRWHGMERKCYCKRIC